MSIRFLKHEEDAIDLVDLLKRGACHYVSLAAPGLTCASACMEFAGGFTIGQRNDFMMAVNRSKETGTLYPRVNITLLPAPSASYGGMDSNVYNEGDYAIEQVAAHILDALKANSHLIKSNTIYFDFRNLGVSESHYVSCLESALKSLNLDDVPEVVTWTPQR